jgi:hypothetical protein
MGVTIRQKGKGKGKPWWVFIAHNGKWKSIKVGDRTAAGATFATLAGLAGARLNFHYHSLTLFALNALFAHCGGAPILTGGELWRSYTNFLLKYIK